MLWQGNLNGLNQIPPLIPTIAPFTYTTAKKIRLGHLVERCVIHQLQHQPNTHIIAENVQIRQDKQTIGELDCLLKQNNIPVHLEMVYKFYLYDETVGNTALEHWIGPNRKDSFVEKLKKLADKQLPLLHKSETAKTLESYHLQAKNIKQYVHFQAQLFVPYQTKNQKFTHINTACIEGVYIHKKYSVKFQEQLWYIPNKHDWLCKPHIHVPWKSYAAIQTELSSFLDQKRAPLCWVKNAANIIQKVVVVWW